MPQPLVLCEETLRNPSVLETRAVPRRVFGRVVVVPKRPLSKPVFWRILAEMGVFRYVVALLPFPIIAILRPSLALPVAQAPLLMIFVIWLFESRVLGLSDTARANALSSGTYADRTVWLLCSFEFGLETDSDTDSVMKKLL